jgi:hypothetical protein
MNAFQSERLLGAKSLVPKGQLFLSMDLRTVKQFEHFNNMFRLYTSPLAICTLLHAHAVGLPGLGVKENFPSWQ